MESVIQIDPKADMEQVKDTRLRPESIASVSFSYVSYNE